MFKRIFSFVTAAAVSFAAMNVQYLSVEALASADVNVLEPVYFMDFNPDADGKFYDSPAGTEGRAEVPRMDNPSGIKLVQYAANTDDMIIKKTGNAGMLVPTAETNSVYTAFSDKSVSGTIGDTSLKTAHLNGVSTVASAELKFPKAYGGTDDTYKKYRFEADWMYHSTNTTDFQYGIIILNLVIGGKAMRLETKSTSGSNDVRDGYPLAFYSPTSDFNITYRNTDTLEADKDGITKSADGIKTEMDGEWIHITIDIDFAGRKLYAKLENNNKNFVREFIGEPTANLGAFDTGLQSVKLCGNKNSVAYINFFDNIKISPIEAPVNEKLLEADKIPYTFDDIKGSNTDITCVTEDLVLPNRKGDVNVTWSAAPSAASKYVNLTNGTIKRPPFSAGDQTITLAPIYEYEGEFYTGKAIEGIVLKAIEGEDYPLEPVYYMDFSPDADGEFYDMPKGEEGRIPVKMMDIGDGAVIFPGHTIFNNKCLALDSDDNVSKMIPNTRTNNEYVAFSKGESAGDVNTGASGAVDDYCLKMIDTGTVNAAPNVKITFPQAYGNPETSGDFVKYRVEVDYKWQQYANLNTTNNAVPTGTTWIGFHFGENAMQLYSKSAAESVNEGNGSGALCFTSKGLGMFAATNQLTPIGEEGNVTARILSGSASGKWVHIAVDFDFEDGTIKASILGDGNEERIIETEIPGGTGAGGATYKSLFTSGLTGVSICGSTGGNMRAVWADNLKVSPMKTIKKTPQEKLDAASNPPLSFEDIKGTNTDANNVTNDLELINQKSGVEITWSAEPSNYVNTISGIITRPAATEGDRQVTLTPTYSVAERTLVGQPIVFTIAKMPENALEKIERIVKTAPFVFDDIKGTNTESTGVTNDLVLPKTVEDDVVVEWKVLSDSMKDFVDTQTGKVTRPKYTAGDVDVTLIPIYKLEDIERNGKEIKIKILKNTLDNSSADIQDAYAIEESDLVYDGDTSSNVKGNLILPKSGKLHNSKITWEASPLIVNTESGEVKRPFGAREMKVVLTASVSNGENTTKREFELTIVDKNYGSSTAGGSGGGGGRGSSVAYTGSATNTGNNSAEDKKAFSDLDNVAWAEKYITKLYDLGVISGDGNGLFYPERSVTREEFTKMLLLSFGIETDTSAENVFSDVDKDSWFASFVQTAYKLRLINGISATEFGTSQSISRQDMGVMIARCLEYKGISLNQTEEESSFADEQDISGYAVEAVRLLKKAGILGGDSNHNFNPAAFAKRAEVAKVLGMIIEKAQVKS